MHENLDITYTSRLLNKVKQNYSTISPEKELLAIVYSVQFFRPYIYEKEIHICYRSNLWNDCIQSKIRCHARWQLKLAEYEYDIVYKIGKINSNTSAFSRNSILVLPFMISEKPDPKGAITLSQFLTLEISKRHCDR